MDNKKSLWYVFFLTQCYKEKRNLGNFRAFSALGVPGNMERPRRAAATKALDLFQAGFGTDPIIIDDISLSDSESDGDDSNDCFTEVEYVIPEENENEDVSLLGGGDAPDVTTADER